MASSTGHGGPLWADLINNNGTELLELESNYAHSYNIYVRLAGGGGQCCGKRAGRRSWTGEKVYS